MRLTGIWNIALLAGLPVSGTLPVRTAEPHDRPLRLAVAGLLYGHLAEITRRTDWGDFVVAGAYEQDTQIHQNNGLRQKVDDALLFDDLEEMPDQTKPELEAAIQSARSGQEVGF